MENGAEAGTRWWEALARERRARVVSAFARVARRTPLGSDANVSIGGTVSTRTCDQLQKPCKTSGRTAVNGLRSRSIRKKIIGHAMRAIAPGFRLGNGLGGPGRTVSLLQKQARQHGGGVFFKPLIEQGADFLAEIGGMRETRKLEALQGVPRSRKQELPGWLGRASGHKPPFQELAKIIVRVRHVNGTSR